MSLCLSCKYRKAKTALRIGAMLFLSLALSACDLVAPQMPPTFDEVEDTAQFVSIPLNATWVFAPGAVTALQRNLLNSWEQRIGLPNRTTVPGDNALRLRARFVPGQDTGRFVYEEFLRRIGGLPAPFTAMKSGDLLSADDALGTYFWAEYRYGDSTICVLGLRRLNAGTRQMPGNTNALDVVLRNCVNGTAQDALKPITAANVGNYPGGSFAGASAPVRMLSPLAGPTPQ